MKQCLYSGPTLAEAGLTSVRAPASPYTTEILFERNSTMPSNRSTDYQGAAKATVDLVDHGHTPDEISDAVLEKLIVISHAKRINIWHKETGLSIEGLAALYRLCETGAGYRRSRLYGGYEIERRRRRRQTEDK
jgi:hypothetical protein